MSTNKSNIIKLFCYFFIIILIFIIPSMTAIGSTYEIVSERNKVKGEIELLGKALQLYRMDHGAFPPDEIKEEDNSRNQEGDYFRYRNDIFIKYLGGRPFNKESAEEGYFDFDLKRIKDNNIYVDQFGEPFWYHNFDDDNLKKKYLNKEFPLHPWKNAIKYKSFQIYSKAHAPSSPYYKGIKKSENFLWITNYFQKDPYSDIVDRNDMILSVVIDILFLLFAISLIIMFIRTENSEKK